MYPYRVTPHLDGHKEMKQMLRLKYSCNANRHRKATCVAEIVQDMLFVTWEDIFTVLCVPCEKRSTKFKLVQPHSFLEILPKLRINFYILL